MCKTRGKCPSRTFSFSGNVSKACFEMSSPFTTVLVKMILIEFDPVGEAGVGRWGEGPFPALCRGGTYFSKSDSAKSETAVQERGKPYFAKPVI